MQCVKCCEDLPIKKEKKSHKKKSIGTLVYEQEYSSPPLRRQEPSSFPIPLSRGKDVDVFRDSLSTIPIDTTVYGLTIPFDISSNPSFALIGGAVRIPSTRKYSVSSFITLPSTLLFDFSIDINGNSGAGPIVISNINNLSLEISVSLYSKTSIYSTLRPTALEITPQAVVLGDGPMTIYVRVYFQIPPIPIVFSDRIPVNTLLSPSVLFRFAGDLLYACSDDSVTGVYNHNAVPRLEGFTQPSYIQITSL